MHSPPVNVKIADVFIAELIKTCQGAACWFKADNFRLIEVRESKELSFDSFIGRVIL